MAKQVFISYCYSESTKALACRVCNTLEEQGVSCWVAPRDLEAGTAYFERKLAALSTSRLFVAILNERVRSSPELATEVKNAEANGIPVLSVALSANLPASPLTSVIKRRTSYWLDVSAVEPAGCEARIAERVRHFLGQEEPPSQLSIDGVSSSPKPASGFPLAYEGPEPFIFVSYKREDADRIHRWLDHVSELGFKFWYDKGIPGGTEWDALIEDKLRSCQLLLLFLSQAATKSKYVRREVKFGDRLDKPIVAIRLEPVTLELGLDMLLNQSQILDASAPDFATQLARALEPARVRH